MILKPQFLGQNKNQFKRVFYADNEQIKLPFYLSTFGRTLKELDIYYPDQTKCFFVYSERGQGEVFIEDEWHTVPEGAAIYIPTGKTVKYRPLKGSEWTTCWITFAGRYAQNFLALGTCVLTGDFSFISAAIDEMYANFDSEDGEEFCQSSLYFLLLKIRKLTATRRDKKTSASDTKARVNLSVKFIMEHFKDDLSVAGLAKNCGVSEEYFCRLFKATTGTNPITYINRLRVANACDLLTLYPNEKIEVIGCECGFKSSAYFNRVFKAEMGESPGAFRKNNQKSEN